MQIHIYIYTCIYMLNESQQHNDKGRAKTFFNKICTSHFILRVRKGYSRFYGERELETEQNCNILTPTLMAVSVVSFSFSRAAQPDDGFLYCILSATSLDPNSIRGPEGHIGLVWLSLPHLVSNSNCILTVLTELYNSSTPTQSPTQSLEWFVWSSSSGNNCYAVQRSLSSGASVYECIIGFFGGVRGVMVIVAGIGHGDTSSNPGLIAFHIALIPLGKVWIQ